MIRYLRQTLTSIVLFLTPASGVEGDTATEIYLIRFAEPSLARYSGPGRLDVHLPESRTYLEALDRIHGRRLAMLGARIGRSPDVVFRYRAVANGLAVRLAAHEAARAAALPGVRNVVRDTPLALHTDVGPAWIGAPALWHGSAPGLAATKGEGVVVGVIDSGINMDHPSFSDSPPDGHVYSNPLGSGNFLGWCDPSHPEHDPSYVCNDKLIGAWDFVEAVSTESDGPEDDFYHGSHVASIAAGNTLDWPKVSGVAPHAHLVAYDVCHTVGFGLQECPASAVTAAIDQAVVDGVDVLNLSIGGGTDPWNDVDAALLDAVAAGIFVAASAGNDGPQAATVGHRGPWIATVGASTHHRLAHHNKLAGLTGGASLPPDDLQGKSLTAGYGSAPVVHAGDCTNPFAPGTFPSGEIAVCDLLSVGRRFSYCENVAAGGAGGCVLANVGGGPTVTSEDFHVVPATHVDAALGDELRAWLAGGSGHQGTLTDSSLTTDPALADHMAAFSSRGPNPSFDVLKPDLAAPGSRILGAVSSTLIFGFTGDELLAVSGTSMASPHVAGAAALLVALHPDWSPAELKSALMTTAVSPLVEEDGATSADPATNAEPFAFGAGRPDLARAALAGLVLPESTSSYAAADPALGGDPSALNLPSLVSSRCDAPCSFQRTVRTTSNQELTWTVTSEVGPGTTVTVSPSAFTLDASNPTRTLDVEGTLDEGLPFGQWQFGAVVLTPDDPAVPETRLTVALRAERLLVFSDGFESGDLSAWTGIVLSVNSP